MNKKTLDKQERIGQIIVTVMAVLNLISPIFNMITDFSLLSVIALVIAAAFSAGLLSGIPWVRYLFALGAALNAFYYFYLLLGGGIELTADHILLILLFILQLVYSVTACLLLLFSKAVKEFLYRQKNG